MNYAFNAQTPASAASGRAAPAPTDSPAEGQLYLQRWENANLGGSNSIPRGIPYDVHGFIHAVK
jgi:hypothetical protein